MEELLQKEVDAICGVMLREQPFVTFVGFCSFCLPVFTFVGRSSERSLKDNPNELGHRLSRMRLIYISKNATTSTLSLASTQSNKDIGTYDSASTTKLRENGTYYVGTYV